MLWLIGQIAVFLLIAALIGFLTGWLMRSLWPSSRNRSREGEMASALERAGSRISDLEAGLRSKRVAVTAAAEQEESALQRVEELEAALATLHSQSDADTGEVDRLQSELEGAVGSIDALRAEMADLRAGSGDFSELGEERDAAPDRLAPPESEDTEPTQGGLFLVPDDELPLHGEEYGLTGTETPGGLGSGDRRSESPPDPDPEMDETEIEALRLDAVALATERFRLTGSGEPDDLTLIYGVGPALERLLHSINITSFHQIAEFDEDDVELVSAALGRAFPDRIRRDDWMGSARALLPEVDGEDP